MNIGSKQKQGRQLHGDEVGDEDERVGDQVGGEAVDAAGGFSEEDWSLVDEDRESFSGGGEEEGECVREET